MHLARCVEHHCIAVVFSILRYVAFTDVQTGGSKMSKENYMSNILLEAPVRATVAAAQVRDAVVHRVATSRNPVIVVAVAAAIVLGLGFIAYLTGICLGRGYRGFGGVINVNWNNPASANVKFACIR
ncbi:hypothetical protein EDF50_1237 [Frigoribacterium sp. PhB24]|nr:hypothetical protein EDF50_1237 [Frigoribacterium sp. PhB24]